jgi:hypothetical protein
MTEEQRTQRVADALGMTVAEVRDRGCAGWVGPLLSLIEAENAFWGDRVRVKGVEAMMTAMYERGKA